MERTSRESRETWTKRVERWGDSGLTAKEYATEIGVNVHSLSWWKWHLSSGAQPQAREHVRPRTRRSWGRPRSGRAVFAQPLVTLVADLGRGANCSDRLFLGRGASLILISGRDAVRSTKPCRRRRHHRRVRHGG